MSERPPLGVTSTQVILKKISEVTSDDIKAANGILLGAPVHMHNLSIESMQFLGRLPAAEIGIRLALGAQPAAVFRMITSRALALAAVGVALGVLGCLALRRVLAALLFGIGPSDPARIAGAIGVRLFVTVAAAFFPARRAMRTDPMVALREE